MSSQRSIDASEIDLWVARPQSIRSPALLDRWRSWLSPEEALRHSAFHFERHRHEYLVTRGLVRTALSSYRPISPEAWIFRKNAYDRPLIEPSCGLHFNLSNTQSLVVCVVSEHHEVGVDVEPMSHAKEILEVTKTVFSDRELADLHALSGEALRDRAVSLWTIKEAYIKARGMGVSLPLKEITVRFEIPAAPHLDLAPVIADDAHAWWIRTRDIDEHRVAFAVRAGRDASLNVRAIDLDSE